MMRLFFTICIILFCCTTSTLKAQLDSTRGSVNGTIIDTISSNIDRATVSLINASDTTKRKNTLSDSLGRFRFSDIDFDTYILRVSFQGYDVLDKYVVLSKSKPAVVLDSITLQQTLNELGTVVVTAIVPVSLKGDTTEYNADAFGVKPNAVVEDLLKKLPGIEVDEDGSIKAQGETVTRVFVDGKRFFGNDPKMATQNLPKDVVEKIQVFDGKSDQSEFTGFDDGSSIKTINIVTKKNKRKGWFGKSSAAMGNDQPTLSNPFYDVHARVFRFLGDRQIAFIGQFNQTYKQPFLLDADDNNGLSRKVAGAINYKDKLGKKTDFSGSYAYDESSDHTARKSFTQRLFQNDTLQNTDQTSISENDVQNHKINLNWETKFDSSNELRIRSDIGFANNKSDNTSNSSIDRIINGADSIPLSKTNGHNSRTGENSNFSAGITYRHRFNKKGRTISISNNISSNSSSSSGFNSSAIYTYDDNKTRYTNQFFNADNTSKSINTTVAFTEPVAEHQLLQFDINNTISKNNSDRHTYNYDSLSQQYTNEDSVLTNLYENNYQSNRATLSYLYNDERVNFSIGSGVQLGNTRSNNLSKALVLAQHYINLYPTASFSYRFSKTRRLRFNYHGRTNQPGVQQLQPVIDNSNPLNIVSGNPDLKQEFNNTFMLRYSNIDKENNKTFFAFFNANFTRNNIVNSVTRLSNGGQSSLPVNLNGNYALSSYVNWGFPISSPKSNLDLSTRVSNARSANLIDDKKNYTYNTTLMQQIKWSTNLKEAFDINFSTNPAYHITHYTVNEEQNGNYYSESFSFDGTWYTRSGWETSARFNYSFYAGLPEGQNTSIPRLNASVAKLLFKDKSGELKITGYDLFNQNKGVSFQRSDNYIRQSQTNILRRYFMLTFTYNLRKFGGKRDAGDRGRNDRGGERRFNNGGRYGGGRAG